MSWRRSSEPDAGKLDHGDAGLFLPRTCSPPDMAKAILDGRTANVSHVPYPSGASSRHEPYEIVDQQTPCIE